MRWPRPRWKHLFIAIGTLYAVHQGVVLYQLPITMNMARNVAEDVCAIAGRGEVDKLKSRYLPARIPSDPGRGTTAYGYNAEFVERLEKIAPHLKDGCAVFVYSVDPWSTFFFGTLWVSIVSRHSHHGIDFYFDHHMLWQAVEDLFSEYPLGPAIFIDGVYLSSAG